MSDELIAEALIGEEAKKFRESDLGRTVLGMAEQELKEAQLALENVNPTDERAITALQNKAWRARQFGQWLDELITNGENALGLWRQNNNDTQNG